MGWHAVKINQLIMRIVVEAIVVNSGLLLSLVNWNLVIACKFLLYKNTWYHITVCQEIIII